ncbi:hypothetical protein NQZ68_013083 [Dissostichus eleginoides]|nr:hypothetical protein NQZ68_013083 [Dissostichus eleginoides]
MRFAANSPDGSQLLPSCKRGKDGRQTGESRADCLGAGWGEASVFAPGQLGFSGNDNKRKSDVQRSRERRSASVISFQNITVFSLLCFVVKVEQRHGEAAGYMLSVWQAAKRGRPSSIRQGQTKSSGPIRWTEGSYGQHANEPPCSRSQGVLIDNTQQP